MSKPKRLQPAAQWLKEQFAFEYCAECSGDAQHHTALLFFGNWIARCDYAPDSDGNPHSEIAAFRAAQEMKG
jgi:hypothetical protein